MPSRMLCTTQPRYSGDRRTGPGGWPPDQAARPRVPARGGAEPSGFGRRSSGPAAGRPPGPGRYHRADPRGHRPRLRRRGRRVRPGAPAQGGRAGRTGHRGRGRDAQARDHVRPGRAAGLARGLPARPGPRLRPELAVRPLHGHRRPGGLRRARWPDAGAAPAGRTRGRVRLQLVPGGAADRARHGRRDAGVRARPGRAGVQPPRDRDRRPAGSPGRNGDRQTR